MLYIHIPYCKSKCTYCDFYSGGNPQWKRYIKAVATELSWRIEELRGDSLSTVYIGGGTPSLMPKDEFASMMTMISRCLESNAIGLTKGIEVTLEVNPEDVTTENITVWKAHGINRISMGVQSLNDQELKIVNRRHSAMKALESLELIKSNFENFSVDIIYGLPGQTQKSLEYTLGKILDYRPQHISVYALTYEEGTALTVLRNQGKIRECSEEKYLQYDDIINQTLSEKGYERYEISNYALPGYRSKHNSGYWIGKEYLGLGPSASSFDGLNVRRTNPPLLKNYIEYFENVERPLVKFYTEETLSSNELMEELILLSLRTREGIDLKKFEARFGSSAALILKESVSAWLKTGHMIQEGDYLKLTQKGINISDYIILSIVGKLSE